MSNSIRMERTFPLEQFANLKIMLESSVDFGDEVDEDTRKIMRLILLAEIEQAYYEYADIIRNFNVNKYESPSAVINALEMFRKNLYNRLKVKSQVVSEENGKLEQKGE